MTQIMKPMEKVVAIKVWTTKKEGRVEIGTKKRSWCFTPTEARQVAAAILEAANSLDHQKGLN